MKRTTFPVLFACVMSAQSVWAATFSAEFWDIPLVPRERVPGLATAPIADPFEFETDILGVVQSVDPTLAFEVSVLDFPNNSFPPVADTAVTVGQPRDPLTGLLTPTLSLDAFIGSALADDLGNDLSAQTVAGSIFRFRGLVDVSAGDNVFGITSDDGFQLSINGAIQPGSETAPRGLGLTEITYTSGTDDQVLFDLIYYDAVQTQAGLFVTLENAVLAPTAVPVPAAGVLLLGGLLGLGLLARRRPA
ncbi:MAG: hypothetical protein AAGL96_16700 [Pseudomonadota bacterium]